MAIVVGCVWSAMTRFCRERPFVAALLVFWLALVKKRRMTDRDPRFWFVDVSQKYLKDR